MLFGLFSDYCLACGGLLAPNGNCILCVIQYEMRGVVPEPPLTDKRVEREISEPWDEQTARTAHRLKEARLVAKRRELELTLLILERERAYGNAVNLAPTDEAAGVADSALIAEIARVREHLTTAQTCATALDNEPTAAQASNVALRERVYRLELAAKWVLGEPAAPVHRFALEHQAEQSRRKLGSSRREFWWRDTFRKLAFPNS